jgi:hypothetical protein
MRRSVFVLGILTFLALAFIIYLAVFSRGILVKNFSDKCRYDGKTYSLGDRFPASDECNTCTCGEDGKVACTPMYCERGNR